MARLVLTKVDERMMRALAQRAARAGRSVEEEHRLILRNALGSAYAEGFKDLLVQMPNVGSDEDFQRTRRPARKVDRRS